MSFRPTAHNLNVVFYGRRHTSACATCRRARAVEQSLRLRRIFDDTRNLVWRTLRRLGIPNDRVEDLFQQVFLITWERLDDIRPGRERAFVYGVVLRVYRGFIGKSSGRDLREMLGEDPDLHASTGACVDAQVEQRRLIELCDAILLRLTRELREVFVLHELEGLSGSEISRLLGIPEGTVHSRLRRARQRVRAEVEALGSTTMSARVDSDG